MTLYESLEQQPSELQDYTEIIWKLPIDDTMINFLIGSEAIEKNGYLEVRNVTSISYKIKTQYNPNATNNTITCIIRKNENTYLVNKKIDFGRMGTNGSDYTLVIETEHNAILMSGQGTYTYQARIYDATGKDITSG